MVKINCTTTEKNCWQVSRPSKNSRCSFGPTAHDMLQQPKIQLWGSWPVMMNVVVLQMLLWFQGHWFCFIIWRRFLLLKSTLVLKLPSLSLTDYYCIFLNCRTISMFFQTHGNLRPHVSLSLYLPFHFRV